MNFNTGFLYTVSCTLDSDQVTQNDTCTTAVESSLNPQSFCCGIVSVSSVLSLSAGADRVQRDSLSPRLQIELRELIPERAAGQRALRRRRRSR